VIYGYLVEVSCCICRPVSAVEETSCPHSPNHHLLCIISYFNVIVASNRVTMHRRYVCVMQQAVHQLQGVLTLFDVQSIL
jgi:hypothetical protein